MRFIIIISIIILIIFAFPDISLCDVYALNYETDIPLITAGTISLAAAYVLKKEQKALSQGDLESLDKSKVNRFDRSAINNWSEDSDTWSDYSDYTLIVSPLFLISLDEPRNDIIVLAAMYLESIALESGLSGIVKSTVNRERPYVYTLFKRIHT